MRQKGPLFQSGCHSASEAGPPFLEMRLATCTTVSLDVAVEDGGEVRPVGEPSGQPIESTRRLSPVEH
jgi:hypothetical protein